ncbi:MAG: ATPase, T2SS/T4P/T4SS family [Candidatus Thorarchaeota archaeon]
MTDESDEMQWIVLEPFRSLIHIRKSSNLIPIEPPWKGDGWESVYVGESSHFPDSNWSLLKASIVEPYLSLYYKEMNETVVSHHTYPLVRSSLEFGLLQELSTTLGKHFQKQALKRASLSERLEQVADDILRNIMKTLPEISELTRERVSKIVAHRATVLGPFFPILLDEFVEEVYVDRPDTPVYFDHSSLGRCQSDFTISHDSVPRLATLLRSESNLHLDRRNPSLKSDLDLFGLNLRVSASLPPLSPDGLHLEIRRARKRPFLMTDLIRNGTVTTEGAAVLFLALGCRFNITITGGPGSGKTTLMNALDIDSPESWRKIYIEDAIESRVLKNHHQVRFRVDPVDETDSRFDKSSEIVKSLHRSPDYLILGEIQTIEHSQALFQAIAAGLRTMQTCHSHSAASLVSRWRYGHDIEEANIALMDLIVTMERPIPGRSKRKVREIVEIRREIANGSLKFKGLNTIYDSRSPNDLKWSEDGAFLLHAKEIGVESHTPALNGITDFLRNETTTLHDGSCGLESIVWSQGHPMKFSGN